MPTRTTTSAIEHLRRAVMLRDGAGLSDGELLGCFIEHRDEAALAVLVQRHGPMVWSTCLRLLSHHDSEDAFQATFIVLVRKAASITPREMVGNWLYGVAHRTALQAKRTAVRRRAREVQMTVMPDAVAVPQDKWLDVQPLLDEELSRLPDNYRAVIVLCDLEGRTRKEVARQLACPEGTVAGRLARARTMLAKRLAQRGVTISGGALAAVLAQNVVSAVVPIALVSNTIGAAASVAAGQVMATGVLSVEVAALSEGVIKAMLMSKLKILAVLMVTLCVIGTGAGVLTHRKVSAGPQETTKKPAAETEAKAPAPAAKRKEDKEMLQGIWHIVYAQAGGKHQANETSKDQIWDFTGDKIVIHYADGGSYKVKYQIDSKQKPKAIDLSPTDEREKSYTYKGIYELDGDRLKVYYSRNVAPDAERPAQFEPHDEDRGMRSFVLKRAVEENVVPLTAWGKDLSAATFKTPPVSVKVDPAAPAEIHGTQTEMRLLATAKRFCVAMRNHHGDKNGNALREYIDPAYLKKHNLTDRDLSVPMLAVGALWNIEVADDGRTILCFVRNGANAKVPINEVLLLRVSDHEGKGGERYLLPSNAPDPMTGAFTPWILRTKIAMPAETGK